MNEDSTTFGSNPDQLAKLWSIGGNAGGGRAEISEDQVKSEMLHDMLAGKLPLDRAIARALPEVLAQLCENIRPFAGDSLGALLCDPQTDLKVLKRIKDYAKDLSKDSEAEHDVAATVYYAAIAGALVNHNERITSFSYGKLSEAFESMLESKWGAADLAALFQKAREHCIQKVNR